MTHSVLDPRWHAEQAAAKPEKATCKWEASRQGTVDTECGRMSVLLPKHFREAIKFCPFCGREIK